MCYTNKNIPAETSTANTTQKGTNMEFVTNFTGVTCVLRRCHGKARTHLRVTASGKVTTTKYSGNGTKFATPEAAFKFAATLPPGDYRVVGPFTPYDGEKVYL